MDIRKGQVWALPYGASGRVVDMVVTAVMTHRSYPVVTCWTVERIGGRKRMRQVALRDFREARLVKDAPPQVATI